MYVLMRVCVVCARELVHIDVDAWQDVVRARVHTRCVCTRARAHYISCRQDTDILAHIGSAAKSR